MYAYNTTKSKNNMSRIKHHDEYQRFLAMNNLDPWSSVISDYEYRPKTVLEEHEALNWDSVVEKYDRPDPPKNDDNDSSWSSSTTSEDAEDSSSTQSDNEGPIDSLYATGTSEQIVNDENPKEIREYPTMNEITQKLREKFEETFKPASLQKDLPLAEPESSESIPSEPSGPSGPSGPLEEAEESEESESEESEESSESSDESQAEIVEVPSGPIVQSPVESSDDDETEIKKPEIREVEEESIDEESQIKENDGSKTSEGSEGSEESEESGKSVV